MRLKYNLLKSSEDNASALAPLEAPPTAHLDLKSNEVYCRKNNTSAIISKVGTLLETLR